MNAWEIFKDVVVNKYADFNGRARRKEYWTFVMMQYLILFAIAYSHYFIGESISRTAFVLYYLGLIIPAFALKVRRLHDTGRSGLMLLISFIPLIGYLLLLYFYVSDSQEGSNEYGPNPKTRNNEDDHLFDELGK